MGEVAARVIKRVKAGEEQAFAELIDLYQNKVYQICLHMTGNRHDAEDLAQDTFMRAFLNMDAYDPEKRFSSWLYRIATNVSIDRLRKRKPDLYLDADIPAAPGMTLYSRLAADEKLPEDQLIHLEMRGMVQKGIGRLPPKYRSAIVLKYMEDLTLQEISEVLDIPVATVKTRIHRGREALRVILSDL